MRPSDVVLGSLAVCVSLGLVACGDGGGGGGAAKGAGPGATPTSASAPAMPTGWSEVAAAALTPAQQAQRQTAEGAKQAMFLRLLGALTEATKSGGPAAAVPVCREQAPAIAREVAAERKVAIGRTSFRLRNPGNTAPAWSEGFVAARATEPRFAAGPDGRLGALLPIRLLRACLACHGPQDALAAGVADTLAKHYPDDRATGFAEGDLRGWFWVEVPSN
ncbi:MAG: DUF3365 domain-containing protein [Planctomycetes bacterium]|nr:DUF3365 domain-containing protein [Planctomycetota bacterium]